ncbi:MAG: phytanoyl-CoA dioxygenase family protein [Alphaproteobacteria bacterium]|nr:phytanoyl-CoA dioxygenase family protein [Alphaproteobacteria bacterium]
MINERDVAFYNENGYLVVDAIYSDDEVAAMRGVVADLVGQAAGISDHDSVYDLEPSHTAERPRVRRIKEPYLVHPLFRRMAEHPKLIAVMKKLIGPNLRLHGGKINIKAAEYGSPVEWHQDWAFYPHTNDDVLAVGVMLDDMTEENGPLLIVPGSHRGPTHDHHVDGVFAGAMDPVRDPIDIASAARVTGRAGACSFHHVRAVHGSEQNRSGRDRMLLLYQVAAADAWDMRRFNEDWETCEARMIAGQSTLEPRMVPCPVRLPYPPARHEGSIYENQRALANRAFNFDPEPDAAPRATERVLEDAD